VACLARSAGVAILWTLAEAVRGRVCNSAVLFDRRGKIRLHYRKVHLCREANEHRAYRRGDDFPVARVGRTTVGAMICFDRHFPEAARTLRLRGAQLILHPTATDWFRPDSGSLNTAMMRTRAYENRCFILSVNQANFGGGSALFGPWGEVLAMAGRREQILYCSIDMNRLRARPRNHFDLLASRRPETYARFQ
jgi:predicted amidohydrolase